MWSVRTLDRNIGSQYYDRMLLTQHKDLVQNEMLEKTAALQTDKLEFIKNPVVAEFLGFSQNSDFTESDLEKSILSNLEQFVLELGKGFAFVARQQHIRTEERDYFIDLVFYNYILKSFVLVDLKTTQITYQDIGQMDMYVQMYDRMKRTETDNPTVGLILCSETDKDVARYNLIIPVNRIEPIVKKEYKPPKFDDSIWRNPFTFSKVSGEDGGRIRVIYNTKVVGFRFKITINFGQGLSKEDASLYVQQMNKMLDKAVNYTREKR